MKTILIAALLLFTSIGFSQTTIDSLLILDKQIDESKSFLIHDYRLPEWGYNRLYFDFFGSSNRSDASSEMVSRINSAYDFVLTPTYFAYSESEAKISSLQGTFSISHSSQENDVELISDTVNTNTDNTSLRVGFNGELHHYLNDAWFVYLNSDNFYQFFQNRNETERTVNGQIIPTTSLSISRTYLPTFRLGAGFGRIRNVTPMLRAIRFAERLKQLDRGSELTREDYTGLSDLFTRRNGYNQVFDRSNKYFYQNLPAAVGQRMKDLEAWEVLYIDETWSEILGNRLEGFEINGGLEIDYEKRDNSNSIVNNELFLVGFYINQRYYHNINPGYQFGISFYGSLSKAVNNNTPYDKFGNGILIFSSLWNITDKMLVESQLGAETGFQSSETWERLDNYFADVDITYYIENNLSFGAQLGYDYSRNSPDVVSFNYDDRFYLSNFETVNTWSAVFQLRYYFRRGIY